jgi:alpha-tubulin suppressor-like RCC1 family protein
MNDRRRRRPSVAILAGLLALTAASARALPAVGTAASWGANAAGQLGDSTTTGTGTPGTVNGLTGVAALAAGGPTGIGDGGHTLALRSDGSVWAWGQNNFGQLGDGCVVNMDCADRAFPAPVPGLHDVVAVAAGRGHSLALLANGHVKAWGRNSSGQLGDGSTQSSGTPVLVLPGVVFLGARAIAAGGRHSLAVLKDGRMVAWGENGFGQLGDGTLTDRVHPTLIVASPLTGYTGVAGGANHSLARHRDGRVFAWGRNHQGQLGNGTFTGSAVPVQIGRLNDVIGVAAGDAHSLVLRVTRTLLAWGGNLSGELGAGLATPNSPTPVPVQGLDTVVALSAGGNHNLAVTVAGAVYAWGSNGSGQLGVPGIIMADAPAVVDTVGAVTTAAAGFAHSVVASVPGTMLSWGKAPAGGYGAPSLDRAVPGQANGATWIRGLAAGLLHTVAVTSAGHVLAVGYNGDGQLGDNGSTFDGGTWSPLPVRVKRTPSTFLTDIVAVSAFAGTSLGLTNKGLVWAWGRNSNGQVGDGSVGPPKFLPVKVAGLHHATAIAAGAEHSVALREDGTLRAWGHNGFGQLGTGGAPANFPTAQLVSGLTHVVAIAAGDAHTLAVRDDGSLWAWGNSSNGQLGDGCQINVNCVNAFVPQPVPGVTGAVAVAAGATWSMALTKDGRVWTWGWNALGQLGNGCTINVNCDDTSVPKPVPGLTGVVAIAAGEQHAMAVDQDGTIWAWGANQFGQLGNGCTLNVNCVHSSVPTAILTVFPRPGTAALGAGGFHTAVAFPAEP